MVSAGRDFSRKQTHFSPRDDVEWSEEMLENAEAILQAHRASAADKATESNEAEDKSKAWDEFYDTHDRFFKDRKWLPSEFPELFDAARHQNEELVVLETGCGAGSTCVPILRAVDNPKLKVYCCDISSAGVGLLQQRLEEMNETRCEAFVADICEKNKSDWPVKDESVDFLILMYTLSALNPDTMQETIQSLSKLLKPGGMIFFRDYHKYDLAQLRFNKNQCLGENFYRRQDGTTTYFFTSEQIRSLFTSSGLEEISNYVDKRLLVNRKRNLKMYRAWLQCKYRKQS